MSNLAATEVNNARAGFVLLQCGLFFRDLFSLFFLLFLALDEGSKWASGRRRRWNGDAFVHFRVTALFCCWRSGVLGCELAMLCLVGLGEGEEESLWYFGIQG